MSENAVSGLRRGRARSPFRSLLSVQMRLAYSSQGLAEKLGLGRKSRNAYAYLLLMAVAFLPLVVVMYSLAKLIAAQSVAIGQPGLPVAMAVSAGQLLVFVMGISSVMSVLYYANDTETLLGLPLTGRQIMLAKLLVAYVAQVLISLVVTGPFLLALGLSLRRTEFWLYALLAEAAIPAIPMALSVLATVLIMRATKGSRKRDQFRVVFGLIFFVVILGVQYLNTSMTAKGPDAVAKMLLERNGLLEAVAGYYPPLKWAAWALTADAAAARIGGLALFCGVSFGVLAAVSTAAQGWFIGGLSTDVSTSRPSGARTLARRKARTGSGAIVFRHRRPALSVAVRDHLTLVRTPNFLLVTMTNLLVFPLILIFGSIGGRGNIPYITGGASGRTLDIVALALVGVHGLMVAGNQVSSTAFTREGRAFWASKMIPLSPKEQVKGKLYYGLAVAGLQLIVMLATAGLAMKVDGTHLLAIAVLGALASLPVTSICIMNDLHSPKLTWEDPHQAMKGNFGTIVAMLLSAAFLGVVGLAVKVMLSAGLATGVVYVATSAILAGAGIALARAVESMAESRYREIEV